jgi:hypothetical protein
MCQQAYSAIFWTRREAHLQAWRRREHSAIVSAMREADEKLAEFVAFIQKTHDDTRRYIDERIDERDDSMNLLLQRLALWEAETRALCNRVERIEAALFERGAPK